MKTIIYLLGLILLLCGGCKYFKKSSSGSVDTITADTIPADEIVDSAAYYSEISNVNEANVSTSQPVARQSAMNGKYYMIVGCFTVGSNADKYAEKLRGMGYEAQIIPGNANFQMVAASSYNNYRESVSEIDKFRNNVTPNAWVFLQR